jgi:hypothetical protein
MGTTPGGVTAVPRTFGILSIVFSSLVLVGSLFGLLGLIVPVALKHAPPTRPEDAQAMAMLSSMYTCMGLISAILTVMSSALLALGIGQLRYRKWAAVWSPRWSIVALGALVVMAILMTTMMRSTFGSIGEMGGANRDPHAAQAVGSMIGVVYGAMMVLFYSPYPILMLVYFSRERVRAAMIA